MKEAIRNLFQTRRAALPLLLAAFAALAVSCHRQQPNDAATGDAQPVAELLSQAEALYAQRSSLDKARAAAATYKRAYMSNYDNYEAVWKLARADYYLGEHETSDDAKLNAYREGITAGQAAVNLAPDKPDGHFWYGANLGGRAEAQGPIYALSSVPDIRREMEAVIKIDESYEDGSAYMALGQIDLELPEMMGGDHKRAVEELEKGLKVSGGENSMLRLRLAEAYYESKRTAEARAQAEAILKMKPDPDFEAEHQEAVEGARQLLKKIG
ncbi:MAG TPA: TRAP transporter TatT component family protein [Pyrinomonadaceae bacterium]|nr:TRAP transporter TatT component family protein [Pyrinomonadaceae bacterium]